MKFLEKNCNYRVNEEEQEKKALHGLYAEHSVTSFEKLTNEEQKKFTYICFL